MANRLIFLFYDFIIFLNPVSRIIFFNAIFRMESLHIVDNRVLLWRENSISVKENEAIFPCTIVYYKILDVLDQLFL